jgi:hypothetical protein
MQIGEELGKDWRVELETKRYVSLSLHFLFPSSLHISLPLHLSQKYNLKKRGEVKSIWIPLPL